MVKRDGFEERHFMAIDTGYPVNIQGRRQLGLNARPRDGEPGSGIQWFEATDLCDTPRPEMGCAPPAAATAAPAASDPAAPAEEDARAAPVPAGPPPMLRGTPLTIEEMLGSLRLGPEGGQAPPVFENVSG